MLFLIRRLEDAIEFTDKTKTETLIHKCYEHLDKLNLQLELSLDLNEFLMNNNQLHSETFKNDHEQYLKQIEGEDEGAAAATGVDEDLKNILTKRLEIRKEYELILEHVLDFNNDQEVEEKLSKVIQYLGHFAKLFVLY